MHALSLRLIMKSSFCFALLAVLVTAISSGIPSCSTAAAHTPIVVPTVKASSLVARWPRDFELVYCWGTMDHQDIGNGCPCAQITLHKRPRDVDVFDCATGNFYPSSGQWSKTRRWNEVTFEFDGQVIYHGVKQPDGTYRGTMIASNGFYGVWEGEFTP